MAKKRARKKSEVRYAQRINSLYSTARAAWNYIAQARGLKPRQVKGAHTRTHWRWRIK